MKVSFIVPVFNNFDLTSECIHSLRNSLPKIEYEIIIVDDGSDETVSRKLKSQNNRLKIIRHSKNFGYAKANNVGAKRATGTFLFLINNDLILEDGWFKPMLAAISKRKVGIAGNVQLDAKSRKIDHAGFSSMETDPCVTKGRAIPESDIPSSPRLRERAWLFVERLSLVLEEWTRASRTGAKTSTSALKSNREDFESS